MNSQRSKTHKNKKATRRIKNTYGSNLKMQQKIWNVYIVWKKMNSIQRYVIAAMIDWHSLKMV